MVIKDKTLNLILKLVKSKYPHIVDLEYGVSYRGRHTFIFYFDIDQLMEQFPDEKLDYNYIFGMRETGMAAPTEIFINFFTNPDINDESLISLIDVLISSIVVDSEYDIVFKPL